MKLLNKEKLQLKVTYELFLRLITNQSSNLLLNFKNVQGVDGTRNKLIIILLIIVILSTLIINQQFSNSLLDVYFNVRSVPKFNSFGEVCNNQEITVKFDKINALYRLDKICNQEVRKKSNFEIIDGNGLANYRSLINVIEGRTVFIYNSFQSQELELIHELKNHITIADDKKIFLYSVIFLSKIHRTTINFTICKFC